MVSSIPRARPHAQELIVNKHKSDSMFFIVWLIWFDLLLLVVAVCVIFMCASVVGVVGVG